MVPTAVVNKTQPFVVQVDDFISQIRQTENEQRSIQMVGYILYYIFQSDFMD